MQDSDNSPTSMVRFVAAFLAVKVLAGLGAALYTYATGTEPPITSTPITIAAVGVAMLWFSKVKNRPMSGLEIMKFSGGTTLADILLSIAWFVGMIWMVGAPLSWQGVAIVMGGNGDGQTAKEAMTIGLVVGSIQVFGLSAFFAWLMTRKLPRMDRASAAPNASEGFSDVQ